MPYFNFTLNIENKHKTVFEICNFSLRMVMDCLLNVTKWDNFRSGN